MWFSIRLAIVSAKSDLTHVFSRFSLLLFLYSRSLKCPLRIASYALRIGVSVMDSEFFIASVYISIARTGNACLFAEAIPIIVNTGTILKHARC